MHAHKLLIQHLASTDWKIVPKGICEEASALHVHTREYGQSTIAWRTGEREKKKKAVHICSSIGDVVGLCPVGRKYDINQTEYLCMGLCRAYHHRCWVDEWERAWTSWADLEWITWIRGFECSVESHNGGLLFQVWIVNRASVIDDTRVHPTGGLGACDLLRGQNTCFIRQVVCFVEKNKLRGSIACFYWSVMMKKRIKTYKLLTSRGISNNHTHIMLQVVHSLDFQSKCCGFESKSITNALGKTLLHICHSSP